MVSLALRRGAICWGVCDVKTEIVVALISLVGILITGAVSIITASAQAKKSHNDLVAKLEHHSEIQDVRLDAKIEKYAAVTDQKIESLAQEVRRHNGFAEKIPAMEADIKNLKSEVNKR